MARTTLTNELTDGMIRSVLVVMMKHHLRSSGAMRAACRRQADKNGKSESCSIKAFLPAEKNQPL